MKHQVSHKACAVDFYSIAYESTDATDTAQLLIFLQEVNDNFYITEELLDLRSLKCTTTSKNIFENVSDAIDKMGLKWDKQCGITTDGAPAKAGQKKRIKSMVCTKVQENGGEAVKLHCTIMRQETLCAKTVQLGNLMNTVVKNVNISQSQGLYHKQFQSFLSDVDTECSAVLQRSYSLKSKIYQFLKVKDQPVDEKTESQWLADLAFLVDLTGHCNALNWTFQGKDQLVSQLYKY